VNDVILLEHLLVRREHAGLTFSLKVPHFAVKRGEFLALVGDSGSGKSTFLDILGLVLRPTSARRFSLRLDQNEGANDVMELWSNGAEGRLAALRRSFLGYVLQTGGLLSFLSVEGNLKLPLLMNGLTVEREDLVAAAERFGIAKYLRRKPERLSGGERQRVAVLRALMHRPAIVLADEPTAAVDKTRARAIVSDFRSFASELESAVIMVTHDLDLVESVADVIYRFKLSKSSSTGIEATCLA
jgi:putative ABC transport system ATP-binding protein